MDVDALNQSVVNTTTEVVSQVDVSTALTLFFTVVIPEVFSRFFLLVSAPILYPIMWWLLIHLVITFFLFEFYFERHEDEDLGWTAALANSVVMMFISMELLRDIYGHDKTPFAIILQLGRDYFSLGLFSEQMIMVSLILLLGIAGVGTAIINYYHVLPRSLAFLVSGHKTVNLLAYFLIVVTYRYKYENPVPLDIITFIALGLFGLLMWSIILLLTRKRKSAHPHRSRKNIF